LLAIRVDDMKCDGCGRCLVACTMGHVLGDSSDNTVMSLPTSLISLTKRDLGFDVGVCRHCEEPLCLDACVAGSVTQDSKTRWVMFDAKRCVGCWSCVMDCPFGAIQMAAAKSSVASMPGKAVICDGCPNWDTPLCAQFCPQGVLQGSKVKGGLVKRQRRERAVYLASGVRRGLNYPPVPRLEADRRA